MNTKVLVYFFFLCTSFGFGQSDYHTGSSQVSIEPSNSIFSTALAGYGLPQEGRFSLSWKYVSDIPGITALTGYEGRLYAVTKNKDLLVGEFLDTKYRFRKISNSEDLTALAELNGKLFGINRNDQLLLAEVTNKDVSWKKISKTMKIYNLTGFGDSFYGTNDAGKLFIGRLTEKEILWQEQKDDIPQGRIISLTSDDNRLYALNENDSLWSGEFKNKKLSWIQIGRNNSLTYDISVKHIAVNEDRLVAVSDDQELYINEHSTEGNLSARALAVKNGDKTAIIVSLDLCGFEKSLTDEIREIVSQKHDIPEAAVLINATHTHFAPITQQWYTLGPFYKSPNAEYLNGIVKKAVVKAIDKALDNMQPSRISFSRGNTNIGRNRRVSANPDAPYDNILDVVRIGDLQDNIKQILFLTGCHPVYENSGEASYTLSANYPGVAREVIEEKTGSNNAIFIQGLGGDINPTSLSYKETGEELAENTLSLLSKEMEGIEGGINFSMDTVQIPIKPWSRDRMKEFKKENSKRTGNLEAERNLRWADLMLERYKEGTIPNFLPVYIQTINIGDWKLIGLSREVVNEYGPAIRAIWPDKMISVAGYCNDITSYLPVDWHIESGVYEGKGSFFWYGAPGNFPTGVKDLIINRIRTSNK